MQTKICCHCKIEKPISDFYVSKKLKFGVNCNCKQCYLIKAKIYKEKNKDKIKSQNKIRRDKNKEEINKRQRELRSKKMKDPIYAEEKRRRDRERFLIPEKKEHREKYTKQYWKEKKLEIKEKKKKYRKENPEYTKQLRLNSYARERGFKDYSELLIDREKRKLKLSNRKIISINYKNQFKDILEFQEAFKPIAIENKKRQDLIKRKQQRIDDIQFKIKDNMRARIRKALRHQSAQKRTPTFELIGCTGLELTQYLLLLGYNKETDHIDHIVPMSRFDLTNPDHQLIVCHYLNLQPLHYIENCSKHDSLPKNWQEIIIKISEVRNINPQPIIEYISSGVLCQS